MSCSISRRWQPRGSGRVGGVISGPSRLTTCDTLWRSTRPGTALSGQTMIIAWTHLHQRPEARQIMLARLFRRQRLELRQVAGTPARQIGRPAEEPFRLLMAEAGELGGLEKSRRL